MLNVVVIGAGPIGIAAAAAIHSDRAFHLAGVVDNGPAKQGKHLGEFLGPHQRLDDGPVIRADLSEITGPIDVAIVCTTSRFDGLAPMLRRCIERRIHVTSSCEEMAWPRFRHPDLAATLDAEAVRAGVALLGTGVNPGFVMDLLPVVLSSMVTRVTAVRCVRRVDAGTRRRPLQAKVGATMTVQQFEALARDGAIGHMGIGESVALIAAGLGHVASPSDVRIGLTPVVAERPLESALGTIHPGAVCGMRNTALWQGESLAVELDLTMAVGLSDPHDKVQLAGPVPLELTIAGSTPGDTATVAALVNTARQLPHARPGLRTMLDFPVSGARYGR